MKIWMIMEMKERRTLLLKEASIIDHLVELYKVILL
jgi:hypothetical protein